MSGYNESMPVPETAALIGEPTHRIMGQRVLMIKPGVSQCLVEFSDGSRGSVPTADLTSTVPAPTADGQSVHPAGTLGDLH